jgi:pimeloyl-ACP methyl ester carboxylesterase
MIAELQAGYRPPLADEDADLEHLAVAQEAMRDRLDLTGVAASFGGPLLVCVGDRDDIVSVEEARTLADGALDGRLEVFPDAGHFVAVDQPQRFNEVLLEFLSQWAT